MNEQRIGSLQNVDIDKYFNEMIRVYKAQSEKEQDDPDKPANLKNLLNTFENLSVKEKNNLIKYFNCMLDDKGKYASKLWDEIQKLVKDGKISRM